MTMNTTKPSYLSFVAPYMVFIVLMVAYPIVITFALSMQNGTKLSFFSNYLSLFRNTYFPRIAFNTAIWTIGTVAIVISINIALALLLNISFPGRTIFRAIILVLPWATPDVVAAVSWKWLYNSMYGVINDILMKLGLIRERIDWLGTPNLALLSAIVANIWKGFPLGTMITLAALQTIPEEIYEAAQLDGCGATKRTLFLTLPLIRSTILALLLISVIWTINYFPLIYIMTGGGPVHGTDTLVTWAYREAFSFLNFNGSSAIVFLVFCLNLVFALLYIKALLGNSYK